MSKLSGPPPLPFDEQKLRRPASPLERGVRQRYVRREHPLPLVACMAGPFSSRRFDGYYGMLPGRACMLALKGRHDLACEALQGFTGAAAIEDHVRDADTAKRFEFIGDLIRSADQGIGA